MPVGFEASFKQRLLLRRDGLYRNNAFSWWMVGYDVPTET